MKVQRVGFGAAERIRGLCEEAGTPVAVGLLAEASVGAMMSLQLHAAHRWFQAIPAEESFFASLPEDYVIERPRIQNGLVRLPDGPGLGLQLDPHALARLSVVLS